MPSGNIQRTLHNFVSTVVSVGSPTEESQQQGRTAQQIRRTVSSGSWIVNDLSLPSPAASQLLHPRQSAGADLDFDFLDGYSNDQTISPRGGQLDHVQPSSSEIIENYIENELGSTYTGHINNRNNMNNANFNTIEFNNQAGISPIASTAGVPLQQLQQILRGATNAANVPNRSSINTSLRNKIVYKLTCTYCKIPVCNRAMRAILLADTKIELYSTDIPPKLLVTMDEDRMTSGCNCRIRDTVCTGCGNVLGYHVSQPCDKCLEARNNGHFWMFCSDGVTPSERMHFDGNGPLYWASLSPMCDFVPASGFIPSAGQSGNSSYDSFCR